MLEDLRNQGLPSSITSGSVNKWMGVAPKEVAFGANPGEQVISEKLLGPTKAITRVNVDNALTGAGQQMQAMLEGASKRGITIDAQTPTYDAVASAVKKIGAPKDSTFTAQMNGIVDDIEGKYPHLDKLTPQEAHALKVELGDAISWSGTAYETPANQAMIRIYRDLNKAITENVPGIAPIQRRWGNLYIAHRNLGQAINKDIVGKGTGPKPTP